MDRLRGILVNFAKKFKASEEQIAVVSHLSLVWLCIANAINPLDIPEALKIMLQELAVIHGSKYLVCNGTFKMTPDTSYQVYMSYGFTHTSKSTSNL